jgi:hypothetical protein
MILDLLFVIIATEALVEIIVASTLLAPVRRFTNWLVGWEKWCAYCISFHIAAVLWIMHTDQYWNLFIMALVVHRLSNVVHEGFVRWFKRTPKVSVSSIYIKK